MLKEIIKGFLPWILFSALAGHSSHQLDIAIIVAFVVSIIFEYKALKKGFILSWGTLIFFLFMLIAAVFFKNEWIRQYAWIFSNGALALIAWISLLIKKPFTLQYAKEQVSEDKWQHPLFLKINYLLTMTWGIIFLIGIFLHFLKIPEILTYLPAIFGVWFTRWFPRYYREKNA